MVIPVTVWLWYDWQAAAVADEEGNLIDEESWSGWKNVDSVMERLELISHNALTPEARILKERFSDSKIRIHGSEDLPPAEWPLPSKEAIKILDKASILLAEKGVNDAATDYDRRLEHLVRASDEMRVTTITMESRLVEWVGMFLPKARFEEDRNEVVKLSSTANDVKILAEQLGVNSPPEGPNEGEWKSIKSWAKLTLQSQLDLEYLEKQIKKLAEIHLPSTCRLLGPMLSARLCVEAHGRARLARLPAGTVQILGAEKAFFEHLKNGAKPPKHGHLFMHPWISRSPKWVRGKIARLLAGKTSIAVRCDHFGGELWGDSHVTEIQEKIETIRNDTPRPNKK